MFYIKKMINNNALLVTNSRLQEYVIMDAGIGFGQKAGNYIEERDFNKMFLLTKDADKENLVDLITTTDSKVFETLELMIAVIKDYLPIDYNGYQYYSLLDHLIGTINRIDNNMMIKSGMSDEDMLIYELELVVSEKIARIIFEQLNLKLTTEEIYIFAIHLNNAQNEISFANLGQETVVILKEILKIVENELNIKKNSFFYNRFLLHLKFFALRHINLNETSDEESVLYESIIQKYQQENKCVELITKHLNDKYQWDISSDEKLYLLLHLAKLNK